jgi:hypothetical protein
VAILRERDFNEGKWLLFGDVAILRGSGYTKGT